jgi:hypothetical protein
LICRTSKRRRSLVEVRAPRKKLDIDPFDISKQGGLLQQISEWIMDTARIPVPEFATIASLAFLGAFYGRRYISPTELGLNVYLIGIAGPASARITRASASKCSDTWPRCRG